ncbi:MAG: 4-hydroxy-2-oxo-heptane,7-dioate aldolase, partial [Pseudomonadota bacterium]
PDGKAEALFYDSVVKGATLASGLQKALDEALAKHYVAQGCLFVAVGADQNVLRDSATALVQRFKD